MKTPIKHQSVSIEEKNTQNYLSLQAFCRVVNVLSKACGEGCFRYAQQPA